MEAATTTLDAPTALLAAREFVLRAVSLAASDPASARFARLADPRLAELACAAARHLAADPAARPDELAPGEDRPEALDLEALFEAARLPRETLAHDHTRVFGLVLGEECPPYEVQYCRQTFSVYRSQRMADVAGFYRAFGLEVGRDAPERVDHVACELELMAWLVAKERYALARAGEPWAERARIARDAQREFAREHLVWWVPAFARALGARARALAPPPPLASALSATLASLIAAERAVLDIAPPVELVQPQPDETALEGPCSECASSPRE